jgi:hypothetical protein
MVLADVDIDTDEDERPNQDGDQKLEHGLEALEVVEVVLEGRHDDANDQVERSERNTAHAARSTRPKGGETRLVCRRPPRRTGGPVPRFEKLEWQEPADGVVIRATTS